MPLIKSVTIRVRVFKTAGVVPSEDDALNQVL